MKKIINTKTIPLVTALCGLLGIALRLWTRGGGPNELGLYEAKPFAWLLLWGLTAGVGALIWFTVRGLKTSRSYRESYPASVAGAVCTVPAAALWLIDSITTLRNTVAVPAMNVISVLCGVFGIAAAICLAVRAVCYALGKKPNFLVDAVVCLALAVRLFSYCQQWSNIPQVSTVIVPFFASLALMLSAYYRIGFDVDMGNRAVSALWSLMSVYLCLIAIFSFEQPGFYGACALWQMGTLCSLRPLKRKKVVEAPEEPAPEDTTPEV